MFRMGAVQVKDSGRRVGRGVRSFDPAAPGRRPRRQATSYARQGTLQGTVYSEGMKSKVANAVVKIRNLNNQKEYASQPTDPKGAYKILMIEEGWYTLGVTTPAGDFNLNYGVYIKAGETAKLSVEMLPGGMLEGKGGTAAAARASSPSRAASFSSWPRPARSASACTR